MGVGTDPGAGALLLRCTEKRQHVLAHRRAVDAGFGTAPRTLARLRKPTGHAFWCSPPDPPHAPGPAYPRPALVSLSALTAR